MFDQISKFANDASTTVTDAVNDIDVSERFTTTSNQVLDTVLDVNRRIVDVAVSNADRVELPFADRFPTPAEAGERYLEFVERAVSVNRDLNQRIAEMIAVDNAQATAKKVAATATSTVKSASKSARTATKSATTATKTATSRVAKKAPAKKAPAKKAPAKKAASKKSAASK